MALWRGSVVEDGDLLVVGPFSPSDENQDVVIGDRIRHDALVEHFIVEDREDVGDGRIMVLVRRINPEEFDARGS